MKEDNPTVDSNPEEGQEDPNTSKTDHSGKQDKNLFSRHPWILPVAAIAIGFFGINAQKIREIFTETIRPRPENKTIHYPLTSENLVVNNQGQVHYTNGSSHNNFDKGGCDTYGFISIEEEDVILFPVPVEFTYLDQGTVALCVTPKKDLMGSEKLKGFSLFRVHNEPKNISLKVTRRDDSSGIKRLHLRLRLKWNMEEGKKSKISKVHSEEALNWEIDGHYHIAGTWGPDGMKLYIDGEPMGENKSETSGPKDFRGGTFVINNSNPDIDEGNNPSHCIVSELQISNYQMNEAEIKAIYYALHPSE